MLRGPKKYQKDAEIHRKIARNSTGRLGDSTKMEECESLDSEMTELQELQCESPEATGQDDEDEVEELRNRCLIYSATNTLFWNSLEYTHTSFTL